MRLVYEEMQLDGVPPNWTTFEESMYQCMRARRVGDTLFFFNEMRRRGFVPNVRQLNPVVCFCAVWLAARACSYVCISGIAQVMLDAFVMRVLAEIISDV